VPKAFPRELNTCGRITVDPTGGFVLVSNRGHNSIAIFRISWGVDMGRLNNVGFHHTRGSTPRHFQFAPSGQSLIVANQDTDSISVFHFDNETGTVILFVILLTR
jgi:6-phosphogluconolactonase (cycloisomerase 2 family)